MKNFLKDFLKGPDPDTSSEVGGLQLKIIWYFWGKNIVLVC